MIIVVLNKTDKSGKLPSVISNSNKKSNFDEFIPKSYMQKTTVERRSPQSYRKRFTERVTKTSKKFEKGKDSQSPTGRKPVDQTTLEYFPAKDPGAGKTSMTHAEFLRMTNLHSRKAEVLRIATENYRMAQRLAGVRSSIGREQNKKSSSVAKMRPRSSIDWPNIQEQKYYGPNQQE